MKHSLTGGSNAHIWWYCPGSVYLNKVVPVVETEAMKEGTRLHEEAAFALTGKGEAKSKIVKDYLSMLPEDFNSYIWDVESPFVRFKYPYAFGTIDLYWRSGPEETLHVCDLKTGSTAVVVENNEQMLTYAYFVSDHKPILHIAQPKVSSRLQTWEPTDEEWEAAKKRIDWALDSVYNGPVVLKTGKHCARCRAKDFCPQKKAEREAIVEGW